MGLQLGLIGHPISHSLSPWIHKQFLEKVGIAGDYRLFDFQSPDLHEDYINQLKNQNLKGFNITVPYKEKIIPYLNSINSEAKIMGAVNTVLYKDNKWIGFNTDGQGYLRSLIESYPYILKNKTIPILIIGAGGAAKGIYYSLSKFGFIHIDIANRTLENAEKIVELKTKNTKTTCYTVEAAEELLGNYKIIIQTTSVGMKPDEYKSIMSLEKLKPTTIVSDIVYQPLMTTFLCEAERKNALLHFGHKMLLYQAQHAFEIWTGCRVNIEGIDAKLQMKLEDK
ncbi:shikimate dehydrogenase [Virgibacillus sp. MSJ-26]|uniref:shikimate dehydrogenase n=1 Tax=Virgibacillus sp. MSJ-26 TaxID=2841522 RepID=UPI001C125C3B|nr:shikimate dehydrogenase [Virgibacillus sp. MSJ-26]MBU5466463.1 shikimate dehydrogenase [Virgibacillus sp. MSJ-26]